MGGLVGLNRLVGSGCHARELPELAYQVRLVEIAGASRHLCPVGRTRLCKLGQQRAQSQHACTAFGCQTDGQFKAANELRRCAAAGALDRFHTCAGGVAAKRCEREFSQRIGRCGKLKPLQQQIVQLLQSLLR